LERFGEECKRISGRLDTLGIRTGWPEPWIPGAPASSLPWRWPLSLWS
jgi:hypothetical protein